VEQTGGEFGTGTGEEFTNSDPNNPDVINYIPIWMPIEDLLQYEKVFPVDVAKLVLKSQKDGWPKEPIVVFEVPK
jgi:hypothetical protein